MSNPPILKVEAIKDSVYAHVSRDATAQDLSLDEFGYSGPFNSSHRPSDGFGSLQDTFDALQHERLMSNADNFGSETHIECLDIVEERGQWKSFDARKLETFLSAIPLGEQSDMSPTDTTSNRRLLLFFIPLVPSSQGTYGSRISMTESSVTTMFKSLHLSMSSLHNTIGRPDYWAPQTRWEYGDSGNLTVCDLLCQHPRWNLAVQGAPLSVYMRHTVNQHLTVYVISHKQGDSSIKALRYLLDATLRGQSSKQRGRAFLEDPFQVHILLSSLSFETSKHHIKRFQHFMWAQFNKVDDHLGDMAARDRSKLEDLTRQLQIVSQNADIHVGNASVAIYAANAIKNAYHRYCSLVKILPSISQPGLEKIEYIIDCMKKQQMWFHNYKSRKDSIMTLVYNLVTQQDAINNFNLAVNMKRDSASMNSIAALTMIFLPGSFTATLLGAGIFSAEARSNNIFVSGIWWLWTTITIPLTLVVILCWWWYRFKKPVSTGQNIKKEAPEQRTFSVGNLEPVS